MVDVLVSCEKFIFCCGAGEILMIAFFCHHEDACS